MTSERTNDPYGGYLETADAHLIRYGRGFSPHLITRAESSYIHDSDGHAMLDFGSGQMCATLGHNHPAVLTAIRAACDEPIHLYSNMLAPSVIELAERLCGLLPPNLQKAMFLSTGAESNEAAVRLAKFATGGFEVISMSSAWHGTTGGVSANTFAGARQGAGPAMPGTMALPAPNAYRCPVRHCAGQCDMTCLEVGFDMVDTLSVGAPAAVLCEPVLAAGGIVVPPEGYLKRLQQHCESREVLLIFDEAQTGLGRVGSMFYFEQAGVTPDILTLSKTLGGGIALAATVTSAEIEQAALEKGFHFYTSHVSDPMPARVGLAIIEVLVEQRLAERAREEGDYFRGELGRLQQRYEAIGDVRGVGLLTGVELVQDRARKTPAPELGRKLVARARALGLHSGLSGSFRDQGASGTVWKLAPPLTVARDETDRALTIIDQALGELAG